LIAEEENIRESQAQSLAEAEDVARTKAEEIVNRAASNADRLGRLNAEILRVIVEQRISVILPG
jgi:vacuolar-type H+-ATPase subunit H